jgi:hypothetical protein
MIPSGAFVGSPKGKRGRREAMGDSVSATSTGYGCREGLAGVVGFVPQSIRGLKMAAMGVAVGPQRSGEKPSAGLKEDMGMEALVLIAKLDDRTQRERMTDTATERPSEPRKILLNLISVGSSLGVREGAERAQAIAHDVQAHSSRRACST